MKCAISVIALAATVGIAKAEYTWNCKITSGGAGYGGIVEIKDKYEEHWGEGDIYIPQQENNIMLCGDRSWSAGNIGGYDADDTDENREKCVEKAFDEIGDEGEICVCSDPDNGYGGISYLFTPWDGGDDDCGALGDTAEALCNTQRC